MSNRVITFVADHNYLDHAKAFMVNCRRQGNWRGDFCAISPGSCHYADLEDRRIHVLHIPDKNWDFMVKFHAFTPFFHRWEQALCIDLDVLVQADLNVVFDQLADRLPAILCDQEDGTTLGCLHNWDKEVDQHADSYAKLEARFPHVNSRVFNAAFIFYAPASIREDTRDRLIALDAEFREINPSRADQMLLNLLLYDRMEYVGKDAVCFFGHDHPGGRVPSESRGWTGDEVPAVLHYSRWYAPWIIKQAWESEWGMTPEQLNDAENGIPPEMGGYRNQRLCRVCHELYAENLAAFDEEFPAR